MPGIWPRSVGMPIHAIEVSPSLASGSPNIRSICTMRPMSWFWPTMIDAGDRAQPGSMSGSER